MEAWGTSEMAYLMSQVVCLFLAIKGEVIGSSNAVLDVHSFLLIALCHFLELQLAEGNTREVINVLYR